MTVVIVQCRLSSARLPNKAMMMLGNRPLVWWTLRAMKCVSASRYVLATDEASLETLQDVCADAGYETMTGPLEDVLERFSIVIRETKADTVVRATADNPFLFYEAAASLLDEYNRRGNADYITYTGLPHGSGVEVMRAQALLEAGESASPFDREHVGPALYNHKDKFNCVMLSAPSRFNHPNLRTTVDTAADLRRARLAERVISGVRRSAANAADGAYTTEEIVSAFNNPRVRCEVLFVPSIAAGQGTGHLKRCVETAAAIGGFVWLPQTEGADDGAALPSAVIDGILHSMDGGSGEGAFEQWQTVHTAPEKDEYALIVADRFALNKEDALMLSECAPLVSLDDGGNATDLCDCLIDIIPSALKRKANITDPALITRPARVRTESRARSAYDLHKVLVCFGGEDPSHLAIKTGKEVKAALPNAEVTVISAEAAENDAEALRVGGEIGGAQGISVIPPVPSLREMLADYDAVVTHYGLTAYEAAAAGCAVLLCASTPLHGRLAREYGFVCLDKKDIKAQKIADAMSKIDALYVTDKGRGDKTLCDVITLASLGTRMSCPVCGGSGEVAARTKRHTYRRCGSCGMVYMSWTMDGETHYEADYFGVQYKKQYGKTYLEDFDTIKAQGARRIGVIDRLSKASRGGHSGTVLDIGCAYGPFLKAAAEDGWQVFGTDVSNAAVSYVQSALLFPACTASFPAFDAAREFGISHFDAVTMWFVIEHFKDLDNVLRAVSRLVKKNGVFAFSTPSGEGVSARMQHDKFYESSPSDHYTVWHPSKADKVLRRYGFKVQKVVSTGHHAERFPPALMLGGGGAVVQMSKLLHLGDTCEVYCKKM